MDVLWEPVFFVLLGLAVVLVRLSEWWFGWDFERWMRVEKPDEKTRQAAAREQEVREAASRSEWQKILRSRMPAEVHGQLLMESPESVRAARLREDEEMMRLAAVMDRERNDRVPRSDLDKLLRRQLP